jgi:hypothetical protein
MATTVTGRLADPNHPNGRRTVGGVTYTRAWLTDSLSDANAVIVNADACIETDATDVTATAVSGHFQADTKHLGVLLDGTDVDTAQGAAIVAATAAHERVAE